MMHEREKSDPAIGAGKPTNKAEASFVADAAEPVEQRAGAEGNAAQTKHAPDTGPGTRVTGARARTESRICRHHPRWEPYALIGGSYGSVRGAQGNLRPYRDPDDQGWSQIGILERTASAAHNGAGTRG